MNQELYIKLNDNSMITPVPISYLVFTIYLSSRYLFIFMNASNLVNAPLNIVNTIEILQSIWSEMLPLPSVFAWSVAPTDLPAAVLSPWILWHLREIRPGIVVTEFCCHFFMLNFKLLFNLFRAKISLSCKVFILQTTTLTGLSTREFRTYNLWQISSIIEICFGFQKSNITWAL